MTGPATAEDTLILHATTVAVDGRGMLFLGASGSGKSSLALQMMALGADLVADNRTIVTRQGGRLVGACPPALGGLIEARGIGLLRAPPAGPAVLVHAVDLDRSETERMPPPRRISFLGVALDLVLGQQARHFPHALYHLLRHGRAEGIGGSAE